MRVRKRAWTENELLINNKIIHDPQQHKDKWQQYFGNDYPIHVELGCGKGNFIIETARANPLVNYIAIERQSTIIAGAARQATESESSPVFVNIDVKRLEEVLAPGEISRFYINFCDPWPNRKKWAKRRLTHTDFLVRYEALLSDGGEIHFKTDNQALFEFTINQFSERGWLIRNVSLDLHKSGMADNIMTEYERKYAARGNPIYRLEASVRSSYLPHIAYNN